MALVLMTAVFAATVTFSASVSAAVNTGTLEVTDDPVQPDGSIEVTGDLDSDSAVTFLIQDPDDNDFATVTRTGLSGTFTETIDLSNLDFGGDGLDDGQATISADAGSGFKSSEAATTFEVDNEYPTVDITSPNGGDDLEDTPTIKGTASDDAGLDSVKISIERSDGQYYTGSGWDGTETFLGVSGTTDWSYDTANIDDGSYTVTVKATDQAEHTRSVSDGPPVPDDTEDADTLQVEYTVDTTAPTLTDGDVTVTEKGADDTVSAGDTVKVSAATVTDSPAGVESVEVDASALGGPETLSLSKQDGDTYYNTFTVQNPPASDGSVSLEVEATDEFGNTASDSDSVTLEKEIDSVETLEIDHDFVGIVEDTDEVSVIARGVEDADGNPIASDGNPEYATLEIAGYSKEVKVDEGEIDATIDPTKIPDDTATGEATVSIVEANSQPSTDVELVHEAQGLDEGYQLVGTPMDAEKVRFEGVTDAITSKTTYDPTGDSESTKWVTPDEKQAGSGYYVYGESSDARMGYVFEENGELRSEKLHEGYNLVGATPDLNEKDAADLNDKDETKIGTDLGSGISVGTSDSDVQVYVRDENVELTDRSKGDTSAFTKVTDGTETVDGFEAYFVYVGSGEEIRTVDDEGYDASEGS